jgi:hypothetical protein
MGIGQWLMRQHFPLLIDHFALNALRSTNPESLCFLRKFQITNSKSQTSTKFQAPNRPLFVTGLFGIWSLRFVWILLFGIWNFRMVATLPR